MSIQNAIVHVKETHGYIVESIPIDTFLSLLRIGWFGEYNSLEIHKLSKSKIELQYLMPVECEIEINVRKKKDRQENSKPVKNARIKLEIEGHEIFGLTDINGNFRKTINEIFPNGTTFEIRCKKGKSESKGKYKIENNKIHHKTIFTKRRFWHKLINWLGF